MWKVVAPRWRGNLRRVKQSKAILDHQGELHNCEGIFRFLTQVFNKAFLKP